MKAPYIVMLICASCSVVIAADRATPVRVGAVEIRDHGGRSIGFDALDKRLLLLLRNAGFHAEKLRFAPPADVEYAARQANLTHILYTDVVDIRRTAGAQMGNVLRAKPDRKDEWVAEIEFRLFAVDQVRPVFSGLVNGKNPQ